MIPPPLEPGRRRLRAVAIAAAAFVTLVAVGRYATLSASPLAPSPSQSAAAVAGEAVPSVSPTSDGGGSFIAVDASSVPDDGTVDPPAVESLADGGVVVDLNRASEDDLRRLPGIGPVRARAILALRARMGRFKSADDLARIKGLGRATLRRLRPMTRT